jgi:hypothetical protein
MDKTTLVKEYIEEGKRIIESLDKKSLDINAAMWFYLEDLDEWRLFIASPAVDDKGPKGVYSIVQYVVGSAEIPFGLTINDISIISPKHHLILLMKKAIKTDHGISGIRFLKNVIDNTLVEDAYIYRMN